jgi:hypothetical protein
LSEFSPNIFAHWAINFLGQFLPNYSSSPLFPTVKVMPYLFKKMDWATVWAIISQTHLVTLVIA